MRGLHLECYRLGMPDASPEELQDYAAYLIRMSEAFRTLAKDLLDHDLELDSKFAQAKANVHANEAEKILAEGVGSENHTRASLMMKREEISEELERATRKLKPAADKALKEWKKPTR